MGAVRFTLAFEPARGGQPGPERPLVRGRQAGLHLVGPALRLRVGRRGDGHRARDSRRGHAAQRRSAGRQLPHRCGRIRRSGGRRRHPDHRRGDRRRGASSPGSPPEDFKVYDEDKSQRLTNFAAENIPLELVAAIDVSSSMQDALPAVKRHATDFLAQLAAGRPGHRDRVQRQHLHARPALDRPGDAREGDRTARALGRHRALRRDHPLAGSARAPVRTAGAGRLQRRRGSVQPRADGLGDRAVGGVRRDHLHDRPGARAADHHPAATDEAARRRQRRARLLLRPGGEAGRTSSRKSSRTFAISTCSAMPRRTAPGTAICTGSASKCRATGTASAPGRVTGWRATNRSRLCP